MKTVALGAALTMGLLLAGRASAAPSFDGSARTSTAPAWYEGTTEAARARALGMFERAQAKQADGDFADALADYDRALRAWPHPAVHANVAILLAQRDDPVEAYGHLRSALRFGRDPLEPAVYDSLLRRYRPRLSRQVAELVVGGEASLRIDGGTVSSSAAAAGLVLLPGRHLLIASRTGHATLTQTLDLSPGTRTRLSLELPPQRRWGVAVPWTVLAAGGAAAVASALLHVRAVRHFDAFDTNVANCPVDGCALSVEDDRRAGSILFGAAVAGYVVSGLAIAAGVLLAYLNRPQLEVAPDEHEVAPVVEPLAGALGEEGGS